MLIAVVGANSRSGAAFIRYLEANEPHLSFRSFVRNNSTATAGCGTVIVTDYANLRSAAFDGCDAVVNFVGAVDPKNAAQLRHANVTVPERLASAARSAGVPHMIHMSSLSVYGPCHRIEASTSLAPASPYGRSKLDGERAVREAAGGELKVAFLRVPTIYGPGASSKISTLAMILRKLPVFPVPDSLPRRSIISHGNLARVIVNVLLSQRTGVVLASDPEAFTLAMMKAALPGCARFVHPPNVFFKLLRRVVPGSFASLYESGEIAPELLSYVADLKPTSDSLREALG